MYSFIVALYPCELLKWMLENLNLKAFTCSIFADAYAVLCILSTVAIGKCDSICAVRRHEELRIELSCDCVILVVSYYR